MKMLVCYPKKLLSYTREDETVEEIDGQNFLALSHFIHV